MEPQRIRPKIVNTNSSSNGQTVRNNTVPTAGSSVRPTAKKFDQSPLEPIVEKPRKRRGLAALAIILFILLLGAAATSYYFYNKDKSDTSDLKTQKANLQNQINQMQGANKQQSQTAASNDNFQIKELGVQFKPPADLQDLTYYYVKATDGSLSASLTSRSLMNAEVAYVQTLPTTKQNSNDICGPGSLGTITRVATKPAAAPNVDPNSFKQVGNFYVNFTAVQNGCSNDKTVNDLQLKLINELKNSFNATVKASQ